MAEDKSYTKEFKVDALNKWQSSGQSAADIESELGIGTGSLSRWKEEQEAGEMQEHEGEEAGSIAEEEVGKEARSEMEEGEPEVEAIESEADPESHRAEAAYKVEQQDGNPEAASPEEAQPSLVKKIAGIAAVIFGALGVVLSLAALIGVWVVNKPITDTSVELLITVEGALDVIEVNLLRGEQALQTVQDSLNAAVTELVPIEEMSAILDNLTSVVNSAQSTAETAGKVVGVANSVPFLRPGGNQEPEAGEKLDELSAAMDQISARLDTLNTRIEALSEGGAPGSVLSNINEELASLQAAIQQAESNVSTAGTSVHTLQLNLPKWIDMASIILSLLILWLGIAQYSLLAHGWSWFRAG